MATFGRGVRYEFKQLSLGASGSTNQLLIDVSTTSNYLVWINQIYGVNAVGTAALTTPTFGTYKCKSTSTDTIIKSYAADLFYDERDHLLGQNFVVTNNGSPATIEDLTDRLVYPGQQLRVQSAFNTGGSVVFFVYYTEVYFGGQASV